MSDEVVQYDKLIIGDVVYDLTDEKTRHWYNTTEALFKTMHDGIIILVDAHLKQPDTPSESVMTALALSVGNVLGNLASNISSIDAFIDRVNFHFNNAVRVKASVELFSKLKYKTILDGKCAEC